MNRKNYIIRKENENDYFAVENLTRESFWNLSFPGCNEHYFIHVMREHKDFIPELALVMEVDGEIIANIMYLKSKLVDENGEEKETVSFGPVCVHPKYQRMGYGKILIEYSFEKAREMGFDTVIIFGNPDNYVARGFKSCIRYNVCLDGGYFPAPLLVKELKEGQFDGRRWFYHESDASAPCADEEAVEKFDKLFPPKEKGYRPSQEEFFIHSHSCLNP